MCREDLSVLANVGGYLPQGKVVFLHYKAKECVECDIPHSLLFLSTSTTGTELRLSAHYLAKPKSHFLKSASGGHVHGRPTPCLHPNHTFPVHAYPELALYGDSPCVPSRPPFLLGLYFGLCSLRTEMFRPQRFTASSR